MSLQPNVSPWCPMTRPPPFLRKVSIMSACVSVEATAYPAAVVQGTLSLLRARCSYRKKHMLRWIFAVALGGLPFPDRATHCHKTLPPNLPQDIVP